MKHSHLTLQKGFHGLSTLRWGFLHPRKRGPCDCYACLCQSEITEEKRRKPSSHSRSYFVPAIQLLNPNDPNSLVECLGRKQGDWIHPLCRSWFHRWIPSFWQLSTTIWDVEVAQRARHWQVRLAMCMFCQDLVDETTCRWLGLPHQVHVAQGQVDILPDPNPERISLDIFNNALDLARSIPNTVRAAMLSLLTQSLALCPIQCPCQRRRAMSPHNASHACCPCEVPALTSKWSWSSWLMGMVKYSLKTPLTSKVAPMPYGLASQVMRTWGPSLR